MEKKERREIRICQLAQKEVVNLCDGQILGYINDIEFDICTGCVTKVIVPGPCKVCGILGRDHEYVIDFCCVKCIGEDTVLVEVDVEKVFLKCKF